jgi:uncharacterized membrane protein YphA (DoxX/SURF4 family)
MEQTRGPVDNWWVRNVGGLKTGFRVLLGIVWLIDGVFKFTSGYTDNFLGDVQNSQANAPGWLSGWYSFWVTQATNSGTAIVYTVGSLEVALGLALVLGFMRKYAYVGGIVLSLLIWAVPEGFGGPYGAGTGATDIGTGIIYALAMEPGRAHRAALPRLERARGVRGPAVRPEAGCRRNGHATRGLTRAEPHRASGFDPGARGFPPPNRSPARGTGGETVGAGTEPPPG